MFEKLKAILVENFDVNEDDITLDTELAGDLGIADVHVIQGDVVGEAGNDTVEVV